MNTRSFTLVGEELERVKNLRTDAQTELKKILTRAEELTKYIERLSDEIAELTADRSALLSRRQREPKDVL